MTGQVRIVVVVAAVLLAGGLATAIAELTGGSSRTGGLAKAGVRGASAHVAPGRRSSLQLVTTAATTHRSSTSVKTSPSSNANARRTAVAARASITTHSSSATRTSSVAPAGSATTSIATSQAHPASPASGHVISASAEGALHLVHVSGSTLYEEGQAHGALSGNVRAQLHVGATFSGSFTISTRQGKLEGRGSAQPHSAGGPIESFAGSDRITGGSGRYAHAHGGGRLSGTFNRRTYAVVLQTRGTVYE